MTDVHGDTTDRSEPREGTLTELAGDLLRDPRLEEVGAEPDPRFTFANERTFLAWNRTALALIGAGLAAVQFLHFNLHGLRLLIALPLIVLGAALALASYGHWLESERAMRLGRPVPYWKMPRVLAGGIVLVAIVGAIVAVVDRIVPRPSPVAIAPGTRHWSPANHATRGSPAIGRRSRGRARDSASPPTSC